MKLNKELPHDFLAEKSLLGCFLFDGQCFDEIVELHLGKEDFYHAQYGIVFDAIRELYLKKTPIDYVNTCGKLKDLGKLDFLQDEELRGKDFVLNLVEEQASSANVFYYAKIIKEKSSLRKIVRTSMQIAEQGTGAIPDTKQFMADVEAKFFGLTQEGRNGGMKKLQTCLLDNLREIQQNEGKNGMASGISTGYKDLDNKLMGMQAGQLIILAARPGMGKTALALNIGMNSIKTSGLPVAIFSLEMLASELSMRILCSTSAIDSRKIKSSSFDARDLQKLSGTIQELSQSPVFINDDGTVTLLDIQSECRKIKSEVGLGLIIVDYIQLMSSHTKNPSREQQIAEISRGLKQLAKELECPILALSQLNRGVETRSENNKRPNVSDLRESGSLEQDADVVMLIYRQDFYDNIKATPEDMPAKDASSSAGKEAEIIVGKNRAGETGTVKLLWVPQHTSFKNLAHQN